jgi:hypothetical protein
MPDEQAHFSLDRAYRYTLWRRWDMFNPDYIQFIGLNPSTADEQRDDPTLRRCIAFAKREGAGALCMTNLFAFRSTDPHLMQQATDPVGPENDWWLIQMAQEARLVIACWGHIGGYLGRDQAVRAVLPALWALGLTAAGAPRHPLYLQKNAVCIPFFKRYRKGDPA